MARYFIDRVSSDKICDYYFIKPIEDSYITLSDKKHIVIRRLVVIPKNKKYIDIFDSQDNI